MRVFLLLVASLLLTDVVNSKKPITPGKIAKRCKNLSTNLLKCLKKGFFPGKIEGCSSSETQITWRQKKKCKKIEEKMLILECDLPCEVVVDGGWSDFGSWGECSHKCGSGMQYRYRECNNPEPSNNGAPCSGGSDQEVQECNTHACPDWGTKKSGKGVDGELLANYTTSSISHPEWTYGKSKEAIQEECRTECARRCDCKGVQYSPTTWDHEECFLMAGSGLYPRFGWSSQLLDTSPSCNILDSGYILDSGVSGKVLTQYTTSAMYNPDWLKGMTTEQVLQRCTEECNAREDCQGIQYSPTSWAHQECFLMSGWTTYARPGWKGQLKSQ